MAEYQYSETSELGTPKGLSKTAVAALNSQVVPISQVVLKIGFTVLIKNALRKGIKCIQANTCDTLWLCLNKKVFNTDIYMDSLLLCDQFIILAQIRI